MNQPVLSETDVISTSHHIVSFKDGKVYKKPRNNSIEALAEITQDYEYLRLIGYDVEFENNVLIMPFIGQPLDSMAENMDELLIAIEKAQKSLPIPHYEGKIGKNIHAITKQKIKERLPDNNFKVKKRTKEAMRAAKKILNKRIPQVISHTDTHSKNFLKDDSGRIHLIDWESSIPGRPEFDLAVLHIYLLEEAAENVITLEQAELTYQKYIKPLIKDQEAYDAFFVFKLVRHLSWAFVLGKVEEGERYILQVNDIMKPYMNS